MIRPEETGFACEIRIREDGAVIYSRQSRMLGSTRDWMSKIRVGDILRVGGTERVVRGALFDANGALRSVDLTILRCSWTGRCYTCLNRYDLLYLHARPTGKHVRLKSRMDHRIRANIMRKDTFTLDCCDVDGIR